MVFFYKLITESPQRERSGSVSPSKRSPCRSPELTRSFSKLINTVDYMAASCGSVIDDIPEREWRLLATLARKREQELEREKLSHQLRKMWDKEQEVRNVITAESSEQYRRYLEQTRQQQQMLHQYNIGMRNLEDRVKQEHLLDYIKNKEMRSSCWRHLTQDQKAQEIIEKAMDLKTKAKLAIDRKIKNEMAEKWKRQMELEHNLKRADMARQKKEALLRDASQRIAINNALDHWESAVIKQEVEIMNEYRRAQHLANAQLTKMRSEKLAQERCWKQDRARRVATLSAQLRECVMRGNTTKSCRKTTRRRTKACPMDLHSVVEDWSCAARIQRFPANFTRSSSVHFTHSTTFMP